MFISVFGPCRGCTLRPAGPPECGAFAARLNAAHFKLLQQQDTPGQALTGLLTAPASATRAGALAAAAAAAAGAPARPQPQAHPRRRRRPQTGAWRGSWPWGNLRNGSWPWGNPRNGSWPWKNPHNDFPAILRSKDQHLLNYINMNLCCKEEKHIKRDHGFPTACLSMTSHYVPVTMD